MQHPPDQAGAEASIPTETTASSNGPNSVCDFIMQHSTDQAGAGASIPTETTGSKNSVCDFKEPPRCAPEKCIENLWKKLHIDDAIKQAKDRDLPELVAKLQKLILLLKEWLVPKYNEKDWPCSEPCKLKGNGAGVYALFKDNGKKLIKIGSSQHCRRRANEQGHKSAFTIMNLEQMKEFVPQVFLNAIKKLKLPGLVFHEDHQGTSDSLLLMQVCEVFFATAYECLTGTVGERLVQVPSKRVIQSITTPTPFEEKVSFFQEQDSRWRDLLCVDVAYIFILSPETETWVGIPPEQTPRSITGRWFCHGIYPAKAPWPKVWRIGGFCEILSASKGGAKSG
jgi:hypothetical protein